MISCGLKVCKKKKSNKTKQHSTCTMWTPYHIDDITQSFFSLSLIKTTNLFSLSHSISTISLPFSYFSSFSLLLFFSLTFSLSTSKQKKRGESVFSLYTRLIVSPSPPHRRPSFLLPLGLSWLPSSLSVPSLWVFSSLGLDNTPPCSTTIPCSRLPPPRPPSSFFR
ncbi:hypothetical protein Scep_021773 [Stephania cephalantha]|uniref:Uncharacterized protein n=1 Tax=Stephania cephalantha TaxID=152367 RepID=A0AAP0F4Y1_9MAGN